MNINPTELYWREIKNAQPLSRADEVRLFKRARQGDEEARQQIIQANLRFVVSVARNYRDYGMTFGELISEGNVGLLEAVKRFDENRGFKFITYAVWWIRQAILKALAEQSRITRPPRSQIDDLQKVDKVASSLSQELGRSPTYNEIAATVDISAQRTHNATEVAQQDLSFDAENPFVRTEISGILARGPQNKQRDSGVTLEEALMAYEEIVIPPPDLPDSPPTTTDPEPAPSESPDSGQPDFWWLGIVIACAVSVGFVTSLAIYSSRRRCSK